ncbi:hypothetical protein FRC07_002644 [Ceratobasidium sp. 392]|nr:hypothetical protein FRC07_002644 [Ceratobasidium sp. 392]
MASVEHPPKAVLSGAEADVERVARIATWAVEEKGYGEDEIETKVVDGETFAPSFLRTVPTLVAPLSNTLDAASATKYRALTDTKSVLEFLDKSRSALSKTHTTSQKPAPSLTPATIEASSLSKLLIDLVHADENDPNFLQIAAKNETERKTKADGFLGKIFVAGRAKAMDEYLAQEDLIPKIKTILEEKKKAAAILNAVYDGSASQAEKNAFFTKSKEAWEVAVPKALAELESKMVGPLTLGDQLSLADIHVGVWLAKVLALVAGKDGTDPTKWADIPSSPGLAEAVGSKDFKLGPKLTAFWTEIITRDGFKKVYADGLH